MKTQNYPPHQKRLLGIDLFRVIAAYGVVLIHGLGEIPRDTNALYITNSFVPFCVPFFLVTAFYFSYNSLISKGIKFYLNNRIKRILIPYFAWTLIYLLARAIGWFLGKKESFNRLISDPANIILFGASGVHLYFLPTLFCGTLVAIPIIKIFLKSHNGFLIILSFCVSILLYHFMTITGNNFILGEGIAFAQMIDISKVPNIWLFQGMRLILVALAWTIMCLPYIIFSIIINNDKCKKIIYHCTLHVKHGKESRFFFMLSFPLSIAVILGLKINFLYLLLPYISFLYAIIISGLFSQNKLIIFISTKLSYFSFGIYLCHALITTGFLPVIVKVYPQILNFNLSPLLLIVSSLVIFLISLAITYCISLNKTVARILLAA
ncbi:MAG: acyltransferase [Nostocaceae cyanobacterium]|nr:acyltransferase [Nostocaceae cyanobacterium]